ncbi:unnamed protein product [Sphagnum balticum]
MSQEPLTQELFLRVKEALDRLHLRIPFPLEAAPLISKLITLVDRGGPSAKSTEKSSLPASTLDLALKHQMAKIVKENNRLHLEIISARE